MLAYSGNIQHTNYLFLRAALTRLQACTRGQESPESEKALAIGGDTHIVDRKALKMIGIQHLNDLERSLQKPEMPTLPVRSWACTSGWEKMKLFCKARSLISQSDYLPRT